ncbi:hypothetical protein [Jeongeupia naejangsanensis]|uniref:Uncharacterized protein n=1 Tax=Jeongeupia naejangsanensis TaxID=613195 RepID=A0ABS2BJG7_9NEIS|nr:hypothetical protein [Jeongeupia naejangsanensis]MBM3115734.1 hypothetical protein [Jeongeupia naejangsanensis]
MSWNAISTQEDAEYLLDLFGGFHDACVREAHFTTKHWVNQNLSMRCSPDLDTSISFVVQRQFTNPSCIELKFESVVRLNWVPTPKNYDSAIYSAVIGFENSEIFWVLDSEDPPSKLDPESECWVVAKSLKWRMADEFLGENLHYGAQP